MARVAIPVTALPSSYDVDGQVLTWTACDSALGNYIPFTGKEVILCLNSGASARVGTISTIADSLGRIATVSRSVGAGEIYVWPLFTLEGFMQAGHQLWIDGANAELKWCILKLL